MGVRGHFGSLLVTVGHFGSLWATMGHYGHCSTDSAQVVVSDRNEAELLKNEAKTKIQLRYGFGKLPKTFFVFVFGMYETTYIRFRFGFVILTAHNYN